METPLYSISSHHAWDLQLRPGLLLVNVRACVFVRVFTVQPLSIPFAPLNKFVFNFTNVQSHMKACVTDF